MKILWCSLFFFLTISAMAQSDSEIIERLDKSGLISKYEKEKITTQTKASEEYNKEHKDRIYINPDLNKMPHYSLGILLAVKQYSTSGISSGLFFSPAEVKVEQGKENLLINRLSSYAKKLFLGKFISQKTLDEIIAKVNLLQLKSEYVLTAYARDRTEAEYFLSSEHFKKFADSLLLRQLVTENGYNILIKKSVNRELRNYDEPLEYLKNYIVIDLKKYPLNPEEYIKKIFSKTAEVLPELKFDSLSYKIEKDKQESFEDFISYNLIVTINQNEKKYTGSCFYNADYKNKKYKDIPEIDVTQYYEVFNKILADKGSSLRLHAVAIDHARFGIIAITKKEFEGLMWSPDGMLHDGFIRLSYENFNNKVTQNKIDEAINLYDSLGLFIHLTKKEKDSCVNEIRNKQINYFSDILSAFKDLVFEIDLKYGVEDGQYKKLTEEIAKVSRGYFKPSEIMDEYKWENKKDFRYGFMLGGKEYKATLSQPDKWLDLKFYELIEQAIAEQHKAGKFYLLYPNDGMRQIYLTDDQFKTLSERKFIELSDSDIEN